MQRRGKEVDESRPIRFLNRFGGPSSLEMPGIRREWLPAAKAWWPLPGLNFSVLDAELAAVTGAVLSLFDFFEGGRLRLAYGAGRVSAFTWDSPSPSCRCRGYPRALRESLGADKGRESWVVDLLALFLSTEALCRWSSVEWCH